MRRIASIAFALATVFTTAAWAQSGQAAGQGDPMRTPDPPILGPHVPRDKAPQAARPHGEARRT